MHVYMPPKLLHSHTKAFQYFSFTTILVKKKKSSTSVSTTQNSIRHESARIPLHTPYVGACVKARISKVFKSRVSHCLRPMAARIGFS